jgi:hypothetical protein
MRAGGVSVLLLLALGSVASALTPRHHRSSQATYLAGHLISNFIASCAQPDTGCPTEDVAGR